MRISDWSSDVCSSDLRVARGDWPRADELLAFLQHDVGDLSRRRIDLEECAFGPCILLDGVAIALAIGLDTGFGIGTANALAGIGRIACRGGRGEHDKGGPERDREGQWRRHWLSSFDQLMAVTKDRKSTRLNSSQ